MFDLSEESFGKEIMMTGGCLQNQESAASFYHILYLWAVARIESGQLPRAVFHVVKKLSRCSVQLFAFCNPNKRRRVTGTSVFVNVAEVIDQLKDNAVLEKRIRLIIAEPACSEKSVCKNGRSTFFNRNRREPLLIPLGWAGVEEKTLHLCPMNRLKARLNICEF